eukprot:g69765.t1
MAAAPKIRAALCPQIRAGLFPQAKLNRNRKIAKISACARAKSYRTEADACVSTGNTKDLKKAELDIAEDPFVLAAEPDAEKVAVLLKNSSSSTLKTVLRADYERKNIIGRGEPADGWKVDCPETSTTIYGKNSKEEELMQRKASLQSKMQTAVQNCKNLLVAIVALLAQEKKRKIRRKT